MHPDGVTTRVEAPPPSSILFGDATSLVEVCEGTLVDEVCLF